MNWRTVNLRIDYPGPITSFADARNSFLKQLYKDEYVLFLSEDEEASLMLLKHLDKLEPSYPYYWIRRINLVHGRYVAWANPDFEPQLVSSKVRFVGRLHEHVEPRKPHGTIDFPIIHNQNGQRSYDSGWKSTSAYRPVLAAKRFLDVMKGR